jgi:hypothetical protein
MTEKGGVLFVLNRDFYKINKITGMFFKIPVIRKILLESWFKTKVCLFKEYSHYQ